MLKDRLKKMNVSIKKCSDITGIPYATMHDLISGKSSISSCKTDTLYRLSLFFHVSMEDLLLESDDKYRQDFDLFRSEVCHKLKSNGDKKFYSAIMQNDDIRHYYNMKWYPEALYLLALSDYLCRIHSWKKNSQYDDIRSYKLQTILYPKSLEIWMHYTKDDAVLKDAIPEFKQFNIIEGSVRDVN